MVGKYLKDIGVKKGETPQTWYHDKKDPREEKWAKQRLIYGFDDRETWSLDHTFCLWIYERLMMFKEVNIIDTDFHKYEFKGREITFTECIEIMLEGFRIGIEGHDYKEDKYEKIDDAFKVFALCHSELWW